MVMSEGGGLRARVHRAAGWAGGGPAGELTVIGEVVAEEIWMEKDG